MTRAFSASLAAVLTAVVLAQAQPAVSAPASGGVTAERQAPPTRVIRFGQVGKAKAGMTVDQGAATGELKKNAPGYCPDSVLPLRPRKPYADEYVVLVPEETGRIAEMDVVGVRARTPQGLGVDTTSAQLKNVYGAKLGKPIETGYGQWGRFVSKGKGAQRRWIGFLFGQHFTDTPLPASAKVTLVGVSKGPRPELMLDGC